MPFLTDLWDFLNLPIDQAIDRMYHTKSKQWVAQFAPASTAPQLGTATQVALVPDHHYLTITAQKTVLPFDRVAFKTFYGVVHSTILIRDGSNEPRSITTFQGLDPALTKLDKKAGEKVVTGPRTLLELAPYKGTAIASTIALLAVEAGDYAKPLLSTLQKMSDFAGVKFFEPAHAIVESLITGVQLLAAVTGEAGAQIAYVGNMPSKTGIFLIAATDLASFKWSDYTFAADYTLLKHGRPVEGMAYLVATIEASEERADWREIPTLKAMEASLDAVVRAAGAELAKPKSKAVQKVEEALMALEWSCLNSPDLCKSDGERIADLCREKVRAFIARAGSGLTSSTERGLTGAGVAARFTLDEIDAFPRPE